MLLRCLNFYDYINAIILKLILLLSCLSLQLSCKVCSEILIFPHSLKKPALESQRGENSREIKLFSSGFQLLIYNFIPVGADKPKFLRLIFAFSLNS